MDKQTSNSTKFKFINGKKWAVASQRHTNVNAGTANKLVQLIKTDGRFLALPYKSANGLLAFRKADKYGKWLEYQDPSYVIEAHKATLSDFDFEPFGLFKSDSRVMTCASDEPMKLWKLNEEEQVSLVTTLQGHSGLFSRLLFHPFVEHLIATTHQNKYLYLWDIERQSIQTTCKEQAGNSDAIAWSCESNFVLFCGSSYDRKIRMMDFRTNNFSTMVDAHSSSKPFQICSIKNESLVSLGFDKKGQREMLVYDLRAMNQPCHTLLIDHQASPFCVQYDMDSNVIFAAGRGDNTIKWFTVENKQAIYLNDYNSGVSQNSVCFVPKLKMDVNSCELMRAMKLTTENTIETISLTVPRKDNSKTYFAEDIFPPTYDLQPIGTAKEFFASPQQFESLQYKTISLKPSDKVSILDVDTNLGGKKKSSSNLLSPTSTLGNEEPTSPLSPSSSSSVVQQQEQMIEIEEEVEIVKLEQVTVQESIQQKKQIKKLIPPIHPIQSQHYSNHYLYLLTLWGHRVGILCFLVLKLVFEWAPKWIYWKLVEKKKDIIKEEWNRAMTIPPQKESVEEVVETIMVEKTISKPIRIKEKRKRLISTSSTPASTSVTPSSTVATPIANVFKLNEQGLEKGKQITSQLPLPLESQWFKRVTDTPKFIEFDPIDVKQGKQCMLILVKGRRNLRTLQLENKYDNLCSNECYVMDCGKVIFQWNGNRANKFKRAKALDLASAIKNKERATEAHIIQMDEGNLPSNPVDKRQFETIFCKHLQGAPETFKKENRASKDFLFEIDDDEYYLHQDSQQHLYQINDSIIDQLEFSSNSIELQSQLLIEIETNGKQPSYKMLESEWCYILEIPNTVFVFTGKKSRLPTKKWAIALGRAMAQEKTKTQPYVAFFRVIEDAEWNIFKDKFSDYPGALLIQQQGMGKTAPASTPRKEQLDANLQDIKSCRVIIPIMTESKPAVEQIMIYRVSNFEKTEYPQELYGHFFSKEAYIILYSYEKIAGSKRCHKIFFWQGADALRKDKGTSALKTIEMSDTIANQQGNSTAVHVRVIQGKEPKSFLQLFENKYIIHKGSVTDWQREGVKLYQVRGADHMGHYAMYTDQVNGNYLHPYYCSLLVENTTLYLWKGKYCSKMNEQIAQKSVTLIQELYANSLEYKVELQEQESKDFIQKVTNYNTLFEMMPQPNNQEQNCMFVIDDFTGQILVRNVCHNHNHSASTNKIVKSTSGKLSKQEEDERVDFFSQEDLESEKVFFVDDVQRSRLFVWIGKLANVQVKRYALKTVLEYAKLLRYESSQYVLEKEGEESVEFQSLFHSWSESSQSVQIRRSKTLNSGSSSDLLPQTDSLTDLYSQLTIKEYPYELLKRKDIALPEGVDKSKLETYLSEEEFEKVFGMSKEAFSKLPPWKMSNLKKQADLF